MRSYRVYDRGADAQLGSENRDEITLVEAKSCVKDESFGAVISVLRVHTRTHTNHKVTKRTGNANVYIGRILWVCFTSTRGSRTG